MKKNKNGVYWEDGKIEYTNDTRVLTYEQMRKEYPMRWVGLTNTTESMGMVVSGTVSAFGDRDELLLMQFKGKFEFVTFTEIEKLNGGPLYNVL